MSSIKRQRGKLVDAQLSMMESIRRRLTRGCVTNGTEAGTQNGGFDGKQCKAEWTKQACAKCRERGGYPERRHGFDALEN